MPSQLNRVIQNLRADLGPESDGELLTRFLTSRDEDALAALVRRYASLVWGVCSRLLNHHDAEDAFQATFLVLVRRAADVPKHAVANWIYGVARQTAVHLRATMAKRKRRETQVVTMPEPTAQAPDTDVRAVLDEELGRLPNHYRSVVLLCDLEGMTRKEAARQLGIPEGSVASRLARARAMLAKRLTRRGVVSAVLASASAPPALVASTVKAACLLAAGKAAGVSAKVAALTEGMVKAMFVTKIKSVLVAVLVVGLAFAGAVGLIYQTQAAGQPKAKEEPPAAEKHQQVTDSQIVDKFDTKLFEQPALGGTGVGVGLSTNPVAVAQEMTGDQALDGLWEDIENKGAWLRFDGSTIKYQPAGESGEEVVKWTCRYNLTLTPMTIDIFEKDGTRHGIFVFERGTLFIALAQIGKTRPTRFERDDATELLVLKRVDRQTGQSTVENVGEPKNKTLAVSAVLESVDAKQAVITAALGQNQATAVRRLLSLLITEKNKEPVPAEAINRAFKFVYAFNKPSTLVDAPVQSDAKIAKGKETLKLNELKPGQIVTLELAADSTGLVVVGIRVVEEGVIAPVKEKKLGKKR